MDEVMGFEEDDDDGAEDMSVDESDDEDTAPAPKSAVVTGSPPISYTPTTPAVGVDPSIDTAMVGVESAASTTDPRVRPP